MQSKPPSRSAQSAGARGRSAKAVARPNAEAALSVHAVLEMRRLYWSNLLRDMLMGLAALQDKQPELFDGRSAVLTHQGERIAISSIQPVLALSMAMPGPQREASLAVQCTVFRIQTPGGEVFTLPLEEIRGVHMLTAELVDKLQKLADQEEDESEGTGGSSGHAPFGFAAFAALPKRPPGPPPEHPSE